MQEQFPGKPEEPSSVSSGISVFSLIVTAIVFFALGVLVTLIVQGVSDDDRLPASSVELAQAVESTLVALTPTAAPPPTRVPIDQTFVEHNPFLGDEDAPIVIVEFSDYLCQFCARFHTETLEPLLEHYDGLVKFVYREYPIIGKQFSVNLGAAAQCVALQGKYWEFTDLIWLNQVNPERREITPDVLLAYAETVDVDVDEYNACIEDGTGFNHVVIDYEAGLNFNISGTPGFFINGNRYTFGAQSLEVFIDVIDAELERMGITPPANS